MKARSLRWIPAAAALVAAACARWAPVPVPMRALPLGRNTPPASTLIVLLPGRGGSPEDFAVARFPELAAAAGVDADFVAADARLSYYLRRTVLDRLRDDLIAPALARGYRRVWLVGVSIGGAGALLYQHRHPGEIAGLLLIAPYLGEPPIAREVAAAGGLARWTPPPVVPADDFQRMLWAALKPWSVQGGVQSVRETLRPPPLYLGFGARDRFAIPDGLLAAALPADHVFIPPGHHDWITWTAVWKMFLAGGALPHRAP